MYVPTCRGGASAATYSYNRGASIDSPTENNATAAITVPTAGAIGISSQARLDIPNPTDTAVIGFQFFTNAPAGTVSKIMTPAPTLSSSSNLSKRKTSLA